MAWHARLDLDYRAEPAAHGPRTRLDFLHEGPLRILQSLYPEGDDICHNVIVHPPSGLVSRWVPAPTRS
jgi:urease accessory protein